MAELPGRPALVTGGTSGIGRATAIALARRGACVALSGRDQRRGGQVVEQITAAGARPFRNTATRNGKPMSFSEIRRLIVAAGCARAAAIEVITDIGPERVAWLLVQELLDRAGFAHGSGPGGQPALRVRFELAVSDHEVLTHDAVIEPGRAEHGPGDLGRPDAVVGQELTDLLQGVYGPRDSRANVTRYIRWNDDLLRERGVQWLNGVLPAARRLLSGSEDTPADLAALTVDMGSDKWGMHYYPQRYTGHFAPFRERPLTLLELGIGGYDDPAEGGGSLRAWKRYFHRALVYGIDVIDKRAIEEQRVGSFQGDQADPEFLDRVLKEIGSAPDIVIDDGSHRSADVIASFRHLFPRMPPGSLYVIEDVGLSYWPQFGGSSTELSTSRTSMGFLKALADGINYEEFDPPGARAIEDFDASVVGIHFYHNIVFVEKGVNHEGSMPKWARDRIAAISREWESQQPGRAAAAGPVSPSGR